MRPRILLAALGAVASTLALATPAGAAPGWECIPTTPGQAVVSGGTGASPACAVGQTPVLAPTYVNPGVGGKPTVQFPAVNVQLINGSGATTALNGTGNLVIGYDETPGAQTGSHNLILGTNQTYTSFGGLLGGVSNTVSGPNAAAFGIGTIASGAQTLAAGNRNQAAGTASSALGGYKNVAKSSYSSITGGCANLTGSGATSAQTICLDSAGHPTQFTSISGGYRNQATGVSSSLMGGLLNSTSDPGGFGPSDITDVIALNNFNTSPASTQTFLASKVVHFSDARTMAHVTASLGYQNDGGTLVDATLEVCYQPAAGGPITTVSFDKPSYHSANLDTWVQSVSGVVNGLAPGDYRVGVCGENESSNIGHGFGAGTIILGETTNLPPPPPPPPFSAAAKTTKKRN